MRVWALGGLVFIGSALIACSDEPLDSSCEGEEGVICTWAGTGEEGFNGDGNPLDTSTLYWPIDVTFTDDGDAYLLDWNNHRVRRVEGDGFETVIGGDFVGDGPPDESDLEEPGAPGTEVLLNHPTQMVPAPDGSLWLVAWHNHKLRRFDPDTGLVFVLGGRGAGFAGDGGPLEKALFNQPNQAVFDREGGAYVLDQRNQVIRYISAEGEVDTVAGTPGEAGFAGDEGSPLAARFDFPSGSNPPPAGGLALDDEGLLYVSDTLNHRIRKIDFGADRISTLAGTGVAGYEGDGGPPEAALLERPAGVSFDGDGSMYIVDTYNGRVRRVLGWQE